MFRPHCSILQLKKSVIRFWKKKESLSVVRQTRLIHLASPPSSLDWFILVAFWSSRLIHQAQWRKTTKHKRSEGNGKKKIKKFPALPRPSKFDKRLLQASQSWSMRAISLGRRHDWHDAFLVTPHQTRNSIRSGVCLSFYNYKLNEKSFSFSLFHSFSWLFCTQTQMADSILLTVYKDMKKENLL